MAELQVSGVCFDVEPPLKRARAAWGPSGYSEGAVTVAQQEEGAGSRGTASGPTPEGATAGNSDPEAAVDDKREAYYSANFKAVLNSVLGSSHEREAVGKDSLETAHRFLALAEPQQQLYVRLFLRKHQWLRVAKLSYDRIAPDLSPIVTSLVQEGFLLDETCLTDTREVLNLLQQGELRALCKEVNLLSSVTGHQKAKMVEAILRHGRQHRPLFGGRSSFLESVTKRAKAVLAGCVRVSEAAAEVFSKFMLLYSLANSSSRMHGEEENGFSQIIFRILQVNIGKLVYPDYEISVARPLFSNQEEFERFYVATKEEQQLISATEDKNTVVVEQLVEKARLMLETEVRRFSSTDSSSEARPTMNDPITHELTTANLIHTPPYLLQFTSGWVYASMLSRSVEYLEKEGNYSLANDILRCLLSQTVVCTASRGRWWERLSLNLDHHMGEKEQCLDVIHVALSDPHLRPARRLSLLQRAHKLCQAVTGQKQQPTSGRLTGKASSKRRNKRKSSQLTYKLSDFPEIDLIPAPEVFITGKLFRTDSQVVFRASASDSPDSHTFVRVEGYAAYHYSSSEGWPCALHAESSTFSAVFALLMWDVIFSPGVPDVFRTPHQAGPLDLYTHHFYDNRKDMIDAKLSWIQSANSEYATIVRPIYSNTLLASLVLRLWRREKRLDCGLGMKDVSSAVEATWEAHCGEVCAGMNWELFPSIKDAKDLAVCMGGNLLSKVCEEFAKDYGHCHGGLPDLTLWNPGMKMCKFVEVKGPGDRLSNKQLVWLSRLLQWGCSVEVCRVRAVS